MVGLLPLKEAILVRIQISQPCEEIKLGAISPLFIVWLVEKYKQRKVIKLNL